MYEGCYSLYILYGKVVFFLFMWIVENVLYIKCDKKINFNGMFVMYIIFVIVSRKLWIYLFYVMKLIIFFLYYCFFWGVFLFVFLLCINGGV